MLDWSYEASRAQSECIRLGRTIHWQRLILIVTTLFAVSGWAGMIYLLTMIAAAR